MPNLSKLFPLVHDGARAMIFVDGENLACRYKAMRGGTPASELMQGWHIPDVAVWAPEISGTDPNSINWTRVLRRYYFTAQTGDADKLAETVDWLKAHDIDAPYVFKRTKERSSKQVDISLCVAMLSHATRRHLEIAILVAGDEDYVPLVRAVQREGVRVHLWSLSSGLDPQLRRAADFYGDLDPFLEVGKSVKD